MTHDELKDPRLNWGMLSQAERDAAYDNNKAVANSAALIATRNETSATVRASQPTALDIACGNRERTKFDLYPARDRSAPCLVFLHGGYWQLNSRQDFAMPVEGVASHD
jgi:acetyl esterase/lipase